MQTFNYTTSRVVCILAIVYCLSCYLLVLGASDDHKGANDGDHEGDNDKPNHSSTNKPSSLNMPSAPKRHRKPKNGTNKHKMLSSDKTKNISAKRDYIVPDYDMWPRRDIPGEWPFNKRHSTSARFMPRAYTLDSTSERNEIIEERDRHHSDLINPQSSEVIAGDLARRYHQREHPGPDHRYSYARHMQNLIQGGHRNFHNGLSPQFDIGNLGPKSYRQCGRFDKDWNRQLEHFDAGMGVGYRKDPKLFRNRARTIDGYFGYPADAPKLQNAF